MKITRLFILFSIPWLAAACATVKQEGPAVPAPGPKISRAKDALKRKTPKFNAPQTLGGLIASDSWTVYPEKQQEEFKGHVSYDNGVYTFRADYALSDRAQSTFSAAGNIYIKQAEKNGPLYEVKADDGRYNYKTGKGRLSARKNRFVYLTYQDAQGTATHAQARKAEFDTNTKTYRLYQDVTITSPTPAGTATVTAERVLARQNDQYAVLEGGVKLSTPQYTMTADTLVMDGKNNKSYAFGSRTLLQGKTEEGQFAVIADRAEAENETRLLSLKGKVQGWLVSDEINKAEINDKF